ncbi:MAG: PA2779 family protein [Desulfobacterales bacterium]|nr:PA2779 family protein [Desulfobacterales bacterium]
MSFLQSMRKPIAALVILAFVSSISWASANAAMVSTDEILKQNQHNLDRERLHMLLDHSEVRKQLEAWGVDSEEAKAWVDSLTDQEIAEMAAQMDQMPAGGSALGTVVFAALIAFLVLLTTDILGYTDIFPFIKKGK